MGVDCVFIVRNGAGITVEDFAMDLRAGNHPGGSGELELESEYDEQWGIQFDSCVMAYHYIEVYPDFVVVHDGTRLRSAHENPYVAEVVDYLKRKCGAGGVWLTGDCMWDSIEDFRDASWTDADWWDPSAGLPGGTA